MAIAFQVTGSGTYAKLIGAAPSVFHSILVKIEARSADELITRIAASYADDVHETTALTGRVLVLREPLKAPDDLLDPAGIDTGASSPQLNLELDHFIHRKGLVDCLRPGEVIRVPSGETYYVLLTGALSVGETIGGGGPSEKRAKLTIKTQTQGKKPYGLEFY
jgi:hypothetical protein